MKHFLINKKLFVLLLICLAGFWVLPKICLAEDFDNIDLKEIGKYLALPEDKVENLLHSLINIFYSEWTDLMASGYSTAEERAVPSIIKKVVQAQVLNHLLIDAPIEVTWKIINNAIKIARLVGIQDVSGILNELEKESVQKAISYGMSVLFENEIRMSPGAMEFKYNSQKGEKKVALFQYIIIYQPSDSKRGEILIRFYSPISLEPPENRGSAGLVVGIYTELTHDLPPFIVDIRGAVENYQWVGNPSMKIDFPAEVPDLGIKPLSWWEKYLLKPIESQIKEVDILITKVTGKSPGLTDIWEKVKSFISKITTFFPAALVQAPEVKEAPSATKEANNAESQPVTPEPQPEPEPEPETKPQSQQLTLAELQEMLDDISEKIDIFSRQVSELVEAKKQQTEKEIKEVEEEEILDKDLDKNEKKDTLCFIKSININTAPKEELQKIIGIGIVIAQRIMEARPFYSLNDLIKVNGIGEKTLQNIINQGCAYVDSIYAGSGSATAQVSDSPQVTLNYLKESPINKEIEVGLSASNLKNTSYDVKISIENGTTTLSEIFNEKENKWQNSYNYLTEVFSGTSFSGDFKLKIKPTENNFRGEADIFARVRESGKSSYLEFKGKINIADPEQATSTPTQEEVPPLAVVINEIAWMGTKANTSDEWIELYNNSSTSIDLTDWTLSWSRGTSTHSITFFPTSTTTIAGYGFYLLERTDNDAVKDVSAGWFGSFGSGGLNNSGEKLELRDGNDRLIDAIDCSEKWFAGSSSPDYISMERIDPRTSGSDSTNWANNNQTIRNGLDANNNPINGTPKAQNSIYQSLPPEAVADLTIDSQNSFGNKAVLTWSTSTDSDTFSEDISYFIYYSGTEADLTSTSTLHATTTAITLTISNLDYNSTYYFGIRAFDGQNYSPLSTTTPYQTATLSTIVSGFSGSDLSTNYFKNNGRKIARTSNGDLYVVYSRSGKIFLAKSSDQGISWPESEIVEVTPQEIDQINPSIAIDSNNNLHIVWQGKVGTSTVYQIRYAKYDGISSPAIEDLTNSEWSQEIPVVAVDSQDNVHIVWLDNKKILHRSLSVQGEISTAIVDTKIKAGNIDIPVSPSLFSLTIDGQNQLHLVWHGTFSSGPSWHYITQYGKRFPNGEWGEIETLNYYEQVADFPSLAIDNQNNLHIVWYSLENLGISGYRSKINYLKYTDSASTIEILDQKEGSNAMVIASPSIALDSRGHLYVIWKRWNEKISQIEYSNLWEEVKNLDLGSNASFAFNNLLWSFYPPKTGYAFIFYEGTNLKFYASQDLIWE